MAKEVRSFKYQQRSRESLKERANARSGNFDSFIKSKYKMYKVRDGKNLIRILPPTWENADHYAYNIWVNYGIGVDNQSYLSLYKMKQEKDPLAEGRRAAERDGDKDLVAALQPRERRLMWVVDRLDEDEGPQLWAAPVTVDKDIISLCLDDDTKEVLWIDDPKKGQDLRFYKEGQGLKTKYPAAKMKLQQPAPIHEDVELKDEWLGFVQENPVPDTLQFYDYDHIAMTFDGQARTNRDDDEDEDEKPRKRKPVVDDDEDEKPKARRARPTVDDDDDADEKPRSRRAAVKDEDDDEPPFKAKGRRAAPVDEDDDDDEDEAPPPAKSIRDRLKARRSATVSKDADDDEDD